FTSLRVICEQIFVRRGRSETYETHFKHVTYTTHTFQEGNVITIIWSVVFRRQDRKNQTARHLATQEVGPGFKVSYNAAKLTVHLGLPVKPVHDVFGITRDPAITLVRKTWVIMVRLIIHHQVDVIACLKEYSHAWISVAWRHTGVILSRLDHPSVERFNTFSG